MPDTDLIAELERMDDKLLRSGMTASELMEFIGAVPTLLPRILAALKQAKTDRETLAAYKEATGIVQDVTHIDELNDALRREAERGAELARQRDELAKEVERLTGCLKKANEQAEHFEREWYLRGDTLEAMTTQRDELAKEVERIKACPECEGKTQVIYAFGKAEACRKCHGTGKRL